MFGHPVVEQHLVWVVDRSFTMGLGTPSRLDRTKDAIRNAIQQLRPTQRFNVVSFSVDVTSFESTAVYATPANRAAAVAWVDGLNAGGPTCVQEALLAGLTHVGIGATSRAVVFCGDDAPNCLPPSTTVLNVSAANVFGVPIHTFFVGSNGLGLQFMQKIANWTGGTLHQVDLAAPTTFQRGDANGDGNIDVTDVTCILSLIFDPDAYSGCLDAADVNDSDNLEIADGVSLLWYLLLQGPPPPTPGPGTCGIWTTGLLGVCHQSLCP